MNKVHKNSQGHQPLCGRVPPCCSKQVNDWKEVTCKYCLRKSPDFQPLTDEERKIMHKSWEHTNNSNKEQKESKKECQ